MREVGGLDQCSNSGSGKKWLEFGYILKITAFEFIHELGVECERKWNQEWLQGR